MKRWGALLLLLSALGAGSILPVDRDARANKTLTVSTITQLLKAIGPNRTIRIKAGVYNITSAKKFQSTYVTWDQSADGPQLHIRNLQNLKLVGVGRPKLLARPRYAWVIRFTKVKKVTLSGLILGHTPHGGCTGGVVAFERSSDLRIEKSDLFGSGTVGIGLKNVSKFRMVTSSIRECTYGIMQITNSRDVSFERCLFTKNREFDLIEISASKKVTFRKCVFLKNRTGSGGYSLFKLDARSTARISQCRFVKNRVEKLTNRRKSLFFRGKNPGLKRLVYRLDPQYNQIYTLTRYRHWIAAGTQAGVVLWNTRKGQAEHLKKAFISANLKVYKGHLWVGAHYALLRFDGSKWKRYLRTRSRGIKLLVDPKGKLLARAGRRVYRYDLSRDRWKRVSRRLAGYDVVYRPNGALWQIQFLRGITRTHKGKVMRIALRSNRFTGSDPREFYKAPDGSFWVVDFRSGYFRWDEVNKRFRRHRTSFIRNSGMAIDGQNKRTWLLDYNKGVMLHASGRKRFFRLGGRAGGYMRSLFVDPKNQDLYVGGWTKMLRLRKSGNRWKIKAFVAR